MLGLGVLVQALADDGRIAGDAQLGAGSRPVVAVEHVAVLVQLDGYQHAAAADVGLERLVLLGGQRAEQLPRPGCALRHWPSSGAVMVSLPLWVPHRLHTCTPPCSRSPG